MGSTSKKKNSRDLSGKSVAITGGARGIGRATAEALVRKGARVAIGDINQTEAEQTAEQLGGGTIALELDVTDRDSFSNFLDEVERQIGPLDVLVNNAGIMPLGLFSEETDLTAQRMIDINIHGVIVGSKLAIERMAPRGSGHIVNIASQAGKTGLPGAATYCATKHAVVGLCEAMRLELRSSGIDVSCVMPAVVNTDLGAGVAAPRGMKRLQPEDVANGIVEALESRRFEVWVPRYAQILMTVSALVPRSARELLLRVLHADTLLLEPDTGARAAYEEAARGGAVDKTPTNAGD